MQASVTLASVFRLALQHNRFTQKSMCVRSALLLHSSTTQPQPTNELLIHLQRRLNIRLRHRLPLFHHLWNKSKSNAAALLQRFTYIIELPTGSTFVAARDDPAASSGKSPQQGITAPMLHLRQQRTRTWKASSSCATRIWLPYCAACRAADQASQDAYTHQPVACTPGPHLLPAQSAEAARSQHAAWNTTGASHCVFTPLPAHPA